MPNYLKKIVLTYVTSWILGPTVIGIQLLLRGRSVTEAAAFFFSVVIRNKTYLITQHLLFLVLLLLVFLVGYFVQVYQKKGRAQMLKRLTLYVLLPITLVLVGFNTLVYLNTNERLAFEWNEALMNQSGLVNDHFKKDQIHRGMSVFGWRGDLDRSIDDLVRAQIEWVAVVPFIYQENEQSATVQPERRPGERSRRDSSFARAIQALKAKGLYVHLKPHLWLGDGWRSNLHPQNGEAWSIWFQSYRNRMLHYARMAQDQNVDLFCIGTELRSSIKAQPEEWKDLIHEIRKIYDGPLTYAANWHDEYEHVGFWEQLDYIGIQAYFPLTKNENPDLESLKKGWQPHLQTLAQFSERYQKSILFTEVGYKSESTAAIKPWEWDRSFAILSKKKSDQTQQLAYEALFQEVWHQDWFAGMYIWEWNTESTKEDAPKDLNFSPRFKPAENVIAKWYGQKPE